MTTPFHPSWPHIVGEIAREAGALIMQVREGALQVEQKADDSPVTLADRLADAYICEQLAHLSRDIPIVSEEGAQVGGAECFWCVDPLDGTKGFIRGGDEFTVNIALIYQGLPVMGVIYIPPTDRLYVGVVGEQAIRYAHGQTTVLRVRTPAQGQVVGLLSHHHNAEKLATIKARFGITEVTTASSSLKFCRVAEGVADVYPRFGTTMEWDTAAGHAIVKAAGGRVTLLEGEAELRYGKQGFINPHFVVWGQIK